LFIDGLIKSQVPSNYRNYGNYKKCPQIFNDSICSHWQLGLYVVYKLFPWAIAVGVQHPYRPTEEKDESEAKGRTLDKMDYDKFLENHKSDFCQNLSGNNTTNQK